MSPGRSSSRKATASDWWGAARALFAAGFRAGDIVHNSFSYHLTPGGFILEAGAHALGCAVIPGGIGNTEQQLEAIAHLKPAGYIGTPDFLKILLDTAEKAGKDASSLKRGARLRRGAAGRRCAQELGDARRRGAAVLCHRRARRHRLRERRARGHDRQRDLIVEIVRPGTGDPVRRRRGRRGRRHLVQSRLPDDPARDRRSLRGAAGRSPCGRTNMRIKGWMGRADQTTKVKGMFVHPEQIAEVGKRHPELGRVRLVVTREAEQDVMTLHGRMRRAGAGLADAVAATLQSVTKLQRRGRSSSRPAAAERRQGDRRRAAGGLRHACNALPQHDPSLRRPSAPSRA